MFEACADALEQERAVGRQCFEKTAQQLNSCSVVVRGITAVPDETPRQVQARLSDILTHELGAPVVSAWRLGWGNLFILKCALPYEVHKMFDLQRTSAFKRRGITFSRMLTGQQQEDHRRLAPLMSRMRAEGCSDARLRDGRLRYTDTAGRPRVVHAAQVTDTTNVRPANADSATGAAGRQDRRPVHNASRAEGDVTGRRERQRSPAPPQDGGAADERRRAAGTSGAPLQEQQLPQPQQWVHKKKQPPPPPPPPPPQQQTTEPQATAG